MGRVADTGFTCLLQGGENPQADIVFIHGLGGHPQKTWSTKKSEPGIPVKTKTRVRKRDRFLHSFRLFNKSSKSEPADTTRILDLVSASKEQLQPDQDISTGDDIDLDIVGKVFWPHDLLEKDFPDVRVLTYGYHSKPQESFQDNLSTLSKGLLTELTNERKDIPHRPIIFIAHSLGGILVKTALDRSQRSTGIEAPLKSIRDATRGVIFFGTPHSGSDMASSAEMLRRILGAFGVTNRSLLATLDSQHDNGQLEDLRLNFAKMLGPIKEKKFQAVNFRENQPLSNRSMGPTANLVVSLASASMESEWASNETLNGNHKSICKFSGSDDQKYRFFKAALLRFLEQINWEDEQEEELSEEACSWLRKLLTCPYKERKDIPNPPRAKGTCEWFTNHKLFKDWKHIDSASLLWVSADPGCGKSVLARHLVDNLLPRNKERTTCYFFFKDGYLDQTTITGALCCVLHQIFQQRPALFSAQVLQKFETVGDRLLDSFPDLWDMLISIAAQQKGREVVCVLDALDECSELGRDLLIGAISSFYSKATRETPRLKFLLTSRPYLDIKTKFYSLERQTPTIHLSGESEEEIDKISQEIKLVIQERATEISNRRGLSSEGRNILITELSRNPNRTYLWLHLILNEVDRILLTPGKIRSKIQQIPKTVDEAYDRILSKSKDIELAKRLLHIVVAAERPLTLREMNLALAIEPQHKSCDGIELVSDDIFRNDVRELCGLFVTILDSKVYLLHQTAREFLVPPQEPAPSKSPSTSATLEWKFTLHPEESNGILAEICLWRLAFDDCSLDSIRNSETDNEWERERERRRKVIEYVASCTFLGFAAQYWAEHFRKGNMKYINSTIEMASTHCDPQLPASQASFWIHRMLTDRDGPKKPTSLMLAAYFGLNEVVARLPKEALMEINTRQGWTALGVAADSGYETIVQQFLAAGANINLQDEYGYTALYKAAKNGHEKIVQQLLAAGADVNLQDKHGVAALHIAAEIGHEKIVQHLVAAGAEINLQEKYCRTALFLAAGNGQEKIVQHLITAGADANLHDNYGNTALHMAASDGDGEIVQHLITAGANINLQDEYGNTALYMAAESGDEKMIQHLIAAGADANLQDIEGQAALHMAAQRNKERGLQYLLAVGADVNLQGGYENQTALQFAAERGHETIVQQLLAAGADVNLQGGYDNQTALQFAAQHGHETIIQHLITAGANINLQDEYGYTALYKAAQNGHEKIVQQLLAAGADANLQDKGGNTALHLAAPHGHETIVQQLLAAGADVGLRNRRNETALELAARYSRDSVVRLLGGTDIDLKELQ